MPDNSKLSEVASQAEAVFADVDKLREAVKQLAVEAERPKTRPELVASIHAQLDELAALA